MPDLHIPVWVAATHFLNLLFLTLLARSGIEVLSALPKLYLSDHCPPGRELVRFSKKVFCADSREPWSSLDEEESWSPVIALPGRKNLGLARHWHFMTVQFWILTGLVYVALLFATGEWRRLVPTSWSIVPGAFHAAATYLNGHLAEPKPGHAYNALQQLAYFAVVFLLAPFQIATGAAMSPSIIARFPRYARLFGGKQAARTLHFLGLCAFAAFVVVHTVMVLLHGLGGEFTYIVLASDPAHANETLALVVGLVGFAVVLLINVVSHRVLAAPPPPRTAADRQARRPFERLLSRWLTSRQRYTRADISPYHRVNGYPPPDRGLPAPGRPRLRRLPTRASAAWSSGRSRSHSATSVRSGRDEPDHQAQLHPGVDEHRRMGRGPARRLILDQCRPTPQARYVVFYANDDKAITENEGRYGYFYGTIPLQLARRPQTILALDMNGAPLPVEHGAPVRLRVETQLGFKMVKWIRSIEFVADYARIGMGQGGWREDQQYYANAAGI